MKFIRENGLGLLAYAAFGLLMIAAQEMLFPPLGAFFEKNPTWALTIPLVCGLVSLAVRRGFRLCQKVLFVSSHRAMTKTA